MPPIDLPGAPGLYEFGQFRVDPEKQLLLRGDEPVALTPKAFQLLLVLIRHSREVVTKDDLMKAVWPDVFVEEGNLSRNVFLLRKALGDSASDPIIITVPGKGYRLAEHVSVVRPGDTRAIHAPTDVGADGAPVTELTVAVATHGRTHVEVDVHRIWRRRGRRARRGRAYTRETAARTRYSRE